MHLGSVHERIVVASFSWLFIVSQAPYDFPELFRDYDAFLNTCDQGAAMGLLESLADNKEGGPPEDATNVHQLGASVTYSYVHITPRASCYHVA